MKQANAHELLPSLLSEGACVVVGRDRIAAGAAAWIAGTGLVWAEMWAEHQGHVHVIPAIHLEALGRELRLVDATGKTTALVSPMTDTEKASRCFSAWAGRVKDHDATGTAWRAFWKDSVEDLVDEEAARIEATERKTDSGQSRKREGDK